MPFSCFLFRDWIIELSFYVQYLKKFLEDEYLDCFDVSLFFSSVVC